MRIAAITVTAALIATAAKADMIPFEPTFKDPNLTAIAYMQDELRNGAQVFVTLAAQRGHCKGTGGGYGTLTIVSGDRTKSYFAKGCWVHGEGTVAFAGTEQKTGRFIGQTFPDSLFRKTAAFRTWQ